MKRKIAATSVSGKKIIFITGTDTGVGKTLLTALLLYHLRKKTGRTLAMKPFCSGGLGDVRLLQSLQPGELTDAEMNPFYFAEPLAPLVATETQKQKNIPLNKVVTSIKRVARQCDQLLIEGSGGLLVPLGAGYTIADLITKLDCEVIIVGQNRLGTINHTLLTIKHLQSIGIKNERMAIVLMGAQVTDPSARTNPKIIARLISPIQGINIGFLGKKCSSAQIIAKVYPKAKKALQQLEKFR